MTEKKMAAFMIANKYFNLVRELIKPINILEVTLTKAIGTK